MITPLWKEDSYLSDISNKITNISYVVVDLFDSLIFQKYKNSNDLHKLVYRSGLKKNIFSIEMGEEYYLNLRMKFQHKELQEEIQPSLKGIFKKFPLRMVKRDCLLDLELELNKQSCYLNPFVYTLLQTLHDEGKSVFLTANTPYSKKQLEELFKHVGLSEYLYSDIYRDFFENSESNIISFLEKISTSKLMNNKQVLYISNNKQNISVAEKLGFQTIHYNILATNLKNPTDLESLYYEENSDEFYMIRKAVESTKTVINNPFFKVGATIAGPLLSMYILKVYKNLIEEGITLVLPLMREGELLSEMLQEVSKFSNNKSLEIKPLYISRKSSYIPALSDDNNIEDILNFFEGIAISINDLFKLFEIPYMDKVHGQKTLYELKSLDLKVYEQIKEKYKKLINIKELKNSKLTLIKKYILDNLGKHRNIATIDIGFNGTIQSNIEKIIETEKYRLKHYLLISRDGIVNKLADGMWISSYINGEKNCDYKNDIIRAVDVFEQLVVGLKGSTLDYKCNQFNVVPVCENLLYEDDEIKNREAIREGILFFFNILLSMNYIEFLEKVDFSKLGQMLHRLIQYPTKQEAKSLGLLSYSSNFGSLSMHKIIENKQLKFDAEYKKVLLHAMDSSYLSSSICWPQGELSIIDNMYSVENMKNTKPVQYLRKISIHLNGNKCARVGIYGAGEIGKVIFESLQFLSLQPICFIDKNKKLHDTVLNSIKIVSPTDSIKLDLDTIIIASNTFTDQIVGDLKKLYGNDFSKLKIVKLNG
ncbi:predicted HAD superfamily hydrolase [Ureibacillus xyleni]|uniref:Predicted HAD superfamily hydrolase n=1 Tax=Ureibacillus xyleni TaxID=614648 RepID=A0A285RC30_9BACL|nr:hypothetical protein [Ureibacillus xyleni]SOB91259.1 predicted HAD superfamily hydrolase [Ureibacillus xyleni]